jgi:hypothetical protein
MTEEVKAQIALVRQPKSTRGERKVKVELHQEWG